MSCDFAEHNTPENIIQAFNAIDPRMRIMCLNGDCYRFHCFLVALFPEAEAYISEHRDHVVTKIGNDLYDIDGKISRKRHEQYHLATDQELKMASKWAYRKFA